MNDVVLFPLKVEVAAGKIVQVLTWWLADPWWKVPRGDLHAPWRCLSSAGRPSEGLEEEAVRAQLEEVEEDTEVTVFCHHIVISTQTKFLVSYLALLPYSCTSFSSSESGCHKGLVASISLCPLSFVLSHTNPLHVLLRYIHESTLWTSSSLLFLLAAHLHCPLYSTLQINIYNSELTGFQRDMQESKNCWKAEANAFSHRTSLWGSMTDCIEEYQLIVGYFDCGLLKILLSLIHYFCASNLFFIFSVEFMYNSHCCKQC